MVFRTLFVFFPRAVASLSGKPDFKKLGISKGPGKKDRKQRDSMVDSMGMKPHAAYIINDD